MQLKTIQDYYEEMYKLYPNVPKSDIKKILQFGWKSLYLHNSYGGDTLIMQKGFWFYCGQLMNDSIKYFEYYKKSKKIQKKCVDNTSEEWYPIQAVARAAAPLKEKFEKPEKSA